MYDEDDKPKALESLTETQHELYMLENRISILKARRAYLQLLIIPAKATQAQTQALALMLTMANSEGKLNKIGAIKALRAKYQINLKEAKDAVEEAQALPQSGIIFN